MGTLPSRFIFPAASTVPAGDWGVVCQCGRVTSTAGRVRQGALAVQRRLEALGLSPVKAGSARDLQQWFVLCPGTGDEACRHRRGPDRVERVCPEGRVEFLLMSNFIELSWTPRCCVR